MSQGTAKESQDIISIIAGAILLLLGGLMTAFYFLGSRDSVMWGFLGLVVLAYGVFLIGLAFVREEYVPSGSIAFVLIGVFTLVLGGGIYSIAVDLGSAFGTLEVAAILMMILGGALLVIGWWTLYTKRKTDEAQLKAVD